MAAFPAAGFDAIGTTVGVHATDPSALDDAVRTARDWLERLDAVASRFRADSEVAAITARSSRAPVALVLSPLLGEVLQASLDAAALTGGLVDPTVGAALLRAGYDDDMAVVKDRAAWTVPGDPAPAPGWRQINYTPDVRLLVMPAGTVLDFGSSAKAYAADRIAALLGETLPGGFLVDLGGDIAVAGPPPEAGWLVRVGHGGGRTDQVITITDQAVATSSTRDRAWASGSGTAHHIIDPRTGAPAERVWAEVTCLGATALEANAASTAAIVLGAQAPSWLRAHGIDASLHAMDGSTVRTGNWPASHDPARAL
ncbi:FAD:protein FMN transferase [Arthrobacter sp. KFRI-F3372]|uniref:FAD:protein FMN transferase n=1 Tax=Micrococcaceae TaxID=1268 RepID=UPI00277E8C63|nr:MULTISPECIES: FAD:protein FMN transferase [Micrococcaceae]MDP9988354.1 thiamine biosynthesis lipoprotein [Arthrobacter oryzae]MEE2523852.1 FAD:protein FMN transferase [Pseudarthrobacter sp. J47]MEE2530282.1 FAD:protein FMN transferase [Pseudarthrobacter sp. J75]WHP61022.1 FAD:protein FMN transferase [Arthrobacter sp. KFRI-F3372]